MNSKSCTSPLAWNGLENTIFLFRYQPNNSLAHQRGQQPVDRWEHRVHRYLYSALQRHKQTRISLSWRLLAYLRCVFDWYWTSFRSRIFCFHGQMMAHWSKSCRRKLVPESPGLKTLPGACRMVFRTSKKWGGRAGSRILVRGGLSPKFAQNRGFPLQLPENCMILKKKLGARGARAPSWIRQWEAQTVVCFVQLWNSMGEDNPHADNQALLASICQTEHWSDLFFMMFEQKEKIKMFWKKKPMWYM